MTSLPYVTAPGNIEKSLTGIKSAAVPEKVSQDFVKTILQIKGGSGNQITSFLRKIGFVNPDGSPSDIYKKFRNPASSGKAAAEAIKIGYAPLFVRNEYMYRLSDDDLRGLILEETGQGEDSSAVGLILTSIKYLKKFTDAKSFTSTSDMELPLAVPPPPTVQREEEHSDMQEHIAGIGMNLGYTINLNLPATSDISVFNAIFKSLKENLLKNA